MRWAVLILWVGVAAAEPLLVTPPADLDLSGAIWRPQVVRGPMPPAGLAPVAPFVSPGTPTATGTIRVGPGAAAAFWLEWLSVVRVRSTRPVELRFVQVTGEAGAVARVHHPGLAVDERTRLLVQGPSGGAAWQVFADTPVEVTIERLDHRVPDLLWDTTRARLRDWAASPRGAARLPALPGRDRLTDAQAIARAVTAALPEAPAGVRSAWRVALLMESWLAVVPWTVESVREVYPDRETLERGGPVVDVDAPFHPSVQLAPGDRWVVEPAVGAMVRFEARAVGDAPPTVEVLHHERVVARLRPPPSVATVQAPTDTPPAFPDRRRLLTDDGRPVGVRRARTWSASSGPVAIRVTGGQALVRYIGGTARPLWSEAFTPTATPQEAIDHARRLLGAAPLPAPRASLVLDALEEPGSACGVDDPAPVVAAWLAWRCLNSDLTASRFEALRARIDAVPDGDARVALLGRLGAVAGDLERAPAVRSLGSGDFRQRVAAWRSQPADRDRRVRARRGWRRAAWLSVPVRRARGTPPRPARAWLDLRDRPRRSGRVWAVTPDRPALIDLPASAFDAARAVRLPLYLQRPEPGVLGLALDAHRLDALTLDDPEVALFAAAPGRHRIAVEGPPDSRALLAYPPLDAAERPPVGRLVRAARLVDVANGPLLAELPPSSGWRWLKVSMVADRALRTPITIRPDHGPTWTATVHFDAPNGVLRPVDGGPEPTSTLEMVVPIAAQATQVVLRSPDAVHLYARLALRRIPLPPVPEAQTHTPASEDLFAAIRTLSRRLITARTVLAGQMRLARAHRLLDLEQGALARYDIEHLEAVPTGVAAWVGALRRRYLRWRDPASHALPAVPAGEVVPLSGNLAPRGAWDRLIPAALAGAPDFPADPRAADALKGPAYHALRGRLLRRAGRFAQAGRAWLRAFDAQASAAFAREALLDLRGDLETDAPADGSAALAMGLLATVTAEGAADPVGRVRALAARRSKWQGMRGLRAPAGDETITFALPAHLRGRTARARRARAAAPWAPGAGHLLRAGQAGGISTVLRRANPVDAVLWCAPLSPEQACRVRIQRDQEPPIERTVLPHTVTRVQVFATPGRHVAEVVLTAPRREALLALRFEAAREAAGTVLDGEAHVFVDRRRRGFSRSMPQAPVEALVLGPTAVRIEARAVIGGETPNALRVDLKRPGAPAWQRRLPLPTARDPSADGVEGRPIQVAHGGTRYLVLPEAGAHTIRLRPETGEVLVRMAVRVPQTPTPRAPYRTLALPRTPGGPLAPVRGLEAVEPAPVAGWLGTLRMGLVARQATDFAGAGDERTTAPDLLETGIGWRRAFVRGIWRARVEGAGRTGLDREPVVGGRWGVRMGPKGPLGALGIGALADGDAWIDGGGARWSLRGRGMMFRPFALAAGVGVTAGLGGHWTVLSDPDERPRGVDPVLGTPWRRDHLFGLQPSASVRWSPLLDHRLLGRVDALSNADLTSLDRVGSQLGWQAIFGAGASSVVTARVDYLFRYWFADADRRVGGTSHSARLTGAWSTWVDDESRVSLGAELRPILDLRDDAAVRFGLWFAYDLTLGRGLDDFMPAEVPFPRLTGRRFYGSPLQDDR